MIKLKLLTALLLTTAVPTNISGMRWEKRVLLVAASDGGDPLLRSQRRIIAEWRSGVEERDLVVVEVIGNKVTGASDEAATLRQRYNLPSNDFSVVLIGKDGGSKLRQARPVSAEMLEKTIDAMPMRRDETR